ncbi:MAG: histone deacetylase family protein [Rhodospirillales bacterium]|nr:histone deacetylase family protein [Rhodospirillales bacterium]
MTTLLYSHPACIEHDPGEYHPERPDRLRAVMAGLEAEKFQHLHRLEAPIVDLAEVKRVHKSDYVDMIMDNVPTEGRVRLDPDTAMSPKSGEASQRAAGAGVAAVDAVINKQARNAFCAVRPPGHHAESSQAMGFCLFNSAATAAFHARAKHGLERVCVIDFDVHHGNGTQHSFENVEGMFYGSSHQYPAYPGTGSTSERGKFSNICNLPLAPGTGSKGFREAYEEVMFPAIRNFNPELLIISAGFDAHINDPLAQLELATEDYRWVTDKLLDIAYDVCDGRVVSMLEGGYDLDALRDSVVVHVQSLMEH